MDVPEKGKGVVTLVSVEKDDLICEYCGDLVTHKEAEQREEKYLEENSDSEYQGYMFFFNYSGNKFWYVYSTSINLHNITVYYYTVLMQQRTTKIDQVDLLTIPNSTT